MIDCADLQRLLTSRDHIDGEGMPLTVVDGLFAIAESVDRLTDAIERQGAPREQDA